MCVRARAREFANNWHIICMCVREREYVKSWHTHLRLGAGGAEQLGAGGTDASDGAKSTEHAEWCRD
jgi:hypothetical protein